MKPTNRGSAPIVSLEGSYYAHSLPDHPIDNWQRLDVHLNEVAVRARQFAHEFHSSKWAWNAGLLHDLGKALDGFQAYLRRENHIDDSNYDETRLGRVNHSSAGAARAEECFNRDGRPFGRVLAYVIAGHHAGLPDYDVCDGGMGALQKRLEEGSTDLDYIRAIADDLAKAQVSLPELPSFVKKENFHFWVRMLFSCLVDADFLDTEQFMQPEQARQRCDRTPLEVLKDALDRHMADIGSKCSDTSVNRARRDVLMACRAAAHQEAGLFTLTVPTGGGKTLSAMTFALDHAIKLGKGRVIYVIPYTSIIEQTAAILATIFGPDNVVEHHSNLDPKKETVRTHLASENWDAPIVVTTNIQFFESLFSARPSQCRKLHNLVKSVVILDEAQLVPPNILAPCVAVINELTQNFGVTVVLSTATQPALPNLRTPTEIVPSSLRLYERLKRTEIFLPGDLETPTTWENLSARLQSHDRVLCIVNSRRDCYDLYHRMPNGTVHLSALMCGEHRSKVIAFIKERLKSGAPLRVVSTQLVEAGVDIDFPVVYRALAGLDSIAQAAGRCNREGTFKQTGHVEVFVPPKPAPRGLLHKGECTTKELRSQSHFDPHSPASYTRYFELFYSRVNDTGKRFLDRLTPSDPGKLDVPFRTEGDNFRLIDEGDRKPVIVRYGASERLLRDLQYGGPNRKLMRRLQRYTVNLYSTVAARMLVNGLLEEVWPGILAQSSVSIYSDATGLDVFREGLPIEDLTGV